MPDYLDAALARLDASSWRPPPTGEIHVGEVMAVRFAPGATNTGADVALHPQMRRRARWERVEIVRRAAAPAIANAYPKDASKARFYAMGNGGAVGGPWVVRSLDTGLYSICAERELRALDAAVAAFTKIFLARVKVSDDGFCLRE